ncbi:hypothetical protein MHUMG1_01199 [Metarhizium humberi]|uniref:NmrA-like domain-containing protein n=1 Tax=Metarhizium humberi TaxID=2596975 RepID=A0A9P8MGX8_9HYPO|nr:hypothetical protein MHUMG1_01199 [Metarhizium humberi]
MATVPSRILILGATGNIGQFITKNILHARPNNAKVTILTSENTVSSKAALINGWKDAGASVITGDITKAADVAAAYRGIDTVVSCVGRAVLDQQKELIRLAEESGTVQWFFPSEYGTDIEHNSKSPTERPHQMKLAIRKYIREHTKRLKVTYVVVGPYFEMWVDGGTCSDQIGGFKVEKGEAFLIGDGQGRIAFTSMQDTGKAVVAALRHPELSYGKALKISSFVVTPSQVLSEFEKQLGRKFTVKYIPLESLERTEAEFWEAGNPIATIATLRRIWAAGGTLYDKWDNDTIGLTSTDSLEGIIKSYLEEKGHLSGSQGEKL